MGGSSMIIALLIGIVVLIFLILKTKVHAFLGLIIAAVIIGLLGGMDPVKIPGSIINGFGGTLGSIGIIIGFGVMMGQIFDKTGAAERMALTFIKLFGKKNEHWAMALTGFIVSIPIFCDSGFVVVSPIAKAISKKTRRSIVAIATPLAAGLVITHSVIPPTPGPLGVVGTFGVDVGSFILWGIVIAIPMAIVSTIYAQWLGQRLYQLPADNEEGWERPAKIEVLESDSQLAPSRELPSGFDSFLPLLVPIILILLNNIAAALKMTGALKTAITFLGNPIIAVGIGLLLALFVLGRDLDRKTAISEMEVGIRSAGIIILVTGGGGALGQILKDSGTGNYVAQLLAGTAIPLIVLPFIIATLVRFVQGSGTVAMITAAGICAPILQAAGANMMLGAFAACIGSLFFSYFNDSYFWVVNNLMGLKDAKEQIRNWSFTSTVAWGVGFIFYLSVCRRKGLFRQVMDKREKHLT